MAIGEVKQKILVVDDHESVLNGTVSVLKQQYPEAEILTAQTAAAAQQMIEANNPDLVVMDLSIPDSPQAIARTETGISLLRSLMRQYPTLNLVVQSAYTKALVRLKPAIDTHEGGFTTADKSLPLQEMLIRVDWALQGVVYTPKEMRTRLEIKPEWLEVLKLAFEQELQDKSIAEKMNVAERTVRHYWTQVQDKLGVYPEPGKNIRIQTEKRAREEGLID
jgi:DNA-binding NarL/FixJ family response regulator